MVTTIKITCDGVFIQSNSYLTETINNNRHHAHSRLSKNHLTLSDFHLNEALRNDKYNINDVGRTEKFTVSIFNRRKPIDTSQLCRSSKLVREINERNTNLLTDNDYTSFEDVNNNVNKSNVNKDKNTCLIKDHGYISSSIVSSSSASSNLSSSTSSITAVGSSIDVDLKPNSLTLQKRHPTGNDPVAKSVNSVLKYNSDKNHHQRIARRYSTGEIIYNGMNSQTAAINLQQSGQTSIVSHHHAFPSTVTTTISTGNPNEPPRYAASQAIPTAPLRQHKRPAPQPGNGITLNMLQQHRNVPPIQQQQQQQQYAPHMNNAANCMLTNMQPNPMLNTILPKSPNQHMSPPHAQLTATNSMGPTNPMSASANCLPQMMPSHGIGNNHIPPGGGMASGVILPGSGGLGHPNLSQSQLQQQHQQHPQQQQQQQQPHSMVPQTPMSNSFHSGGSYESNNLNNLLPSVNSWSSAAPVTQQQQKAPPLMQKKCEVKVKLNAMPWFHGSITRDEAESLLHPREEGLFLVRESTNFPGDYTLCVCFASKVEHYRVKYLDNKLTIDDEEYFENLGQLVAHYEEDADGLCTRLVKCLPKKSKQEITQISKEFLDKGWVIPEKDLQIKESIGKGEFGEVVLGIYRNKPVAIKMLKDSTEAAQNFLAEASVMTTLEHENLVKFLGLVINSQHIYLVTEYMSKGSLVDYLRSRGRQHITKKDQINFAYDTSAGMEYLEAKKVIHRDLAARNVLISDDQVAKVSDFGLAREESSDLDAGKLPIKWTAPEALKNGQFSNKSDIWSFGILLWEIYSFGRIPYPRIPLADVVKHVETGYKMESPEGCPQEIYQMMLDAWNLKPVARPSFHELKQKLQALKKETV